MKATLKGMIKRLLTDGGDYNFFIISINENSYMQFLGGRDSQFLIMETSYLDLDSLQDLKIRNLGWEQPNKGDNYKFTI